MNRRLFIRNTALTGTAILAMPEFGYSSEAIKVEKITSGPKYHWFGYYDKQQLDPTNRYALGMEVDFQYRSPNAGDVIRIGMVDLKKNNRWIELGESKAWGWQQGCMLQWIPGSKQEVIWNDREGERFVTRVHNIKTGKTRTLPMAVYTISPDGKFAMCADFARIDNMRLGYGYKGGEDPYVKQKAPAEAGIHKMDLATGDSKLVISLAQIAEMPHQGKSITDKWHYFNHLLVSPDSKRFIFLNRYRDFYLTPDMKAEENAYAKYVRGNYTTRMFTAGVDGDDIYELDRSGRTSHFIWRDPQHVLAWTRYEDKNGFFLFKDQTRQVEWVGKEVMTQNGHQTYLPDTNNEWILNDTYPDQERKQTLYLYHVPTQRKVVLGRFYQPPESTDEWRCDLHARYSLDGRTVVFDSTHGGDGRQMYMIDVSSIVS